MQGQIIEGGAGQSEPIKRLPRALEALSHRFTDGHEFRRLIADGFEKDRCFLSDSHGQLVHHAFNFRYFIGDPGKVGTQLVQVAEGRLDLGA